MTFSASSIVAWCLKVGADPAGVDFELMISRLQCALPAVVLSFLLQIILAPPVVAAISAILPFVILVSSSMRKDSARECLIWENDFLDSLVRRSGFMGPFRGEKRRVPSSVVVGISFEAGVFRGEYSSFQSLTTSWDQNSSLLWRWGEVGIRGSLEGDARVWGLSLGLLGGVVKRVSSETLRLFSEGELMGYYYYFTDMWMKLTTEG